MKLTDYKSTTLARADVEDIVKVEPVEVRPVKGTSEYEQVVHTTELGKTLRKYDVHLMRVVDGIKQFVKEHIVVVNEGETDEEVVFTAPTTEEKAVTENQIETYVKSLPFKDIKITEINTNAPSATFTAIKVENGAGRRVEVFAYREGAKAPQYVEVTS